MKKNPILFLFAAFLMLVPSGCGIFSAEEEAPRPLAGTLWRPEALAGGEVSPAPGADLRLQFQADGCVSGSAGDNRFYGEYRLSSGGGMRIGPLSVTWRNGPNRAYEERFLSALRLTNFYSIRGGTLALLDERRQVLAVFRGFPPFADRD